MHSTKNLSAPNYRDISELLDRCGLGIPGYQTSINTIPTLLR